MDIINVSLYNKYKPVIDGIDANRIAWFVNIIRSSRTDLRSPWLYSLKEINVQNPKKRCQKRLKNLGVYKKEHESGFAHRLRATKSKPKYKLFILNSISSYLKAWLRVFSSTWFPFLYLRNNKIEVLYSRRNINANRI